MNLLDMRTVVLSYFVTNALITGFIGLVWVRNRQRYAGLAFWLTDFVLQAVGFLLLALRDVAPDLVSIVIAQMLIAAGMLCLYIGLARFVGQPVSQRHNYLSLGVYAGLLVYFTFVHPDISVRTILISAMIVLLTGQCAWLLLRRAAPALRPITRDVGAVLLSYSLLACLRILDLAWSPLARTTGFFESPAVQVLFVFVNQLLSLGLTFALVMMVTRRLELDVERQAAERGRAERVLTESRTRFALAFHSAPYAIIITRAAAGQIIEVNEGFAKIFGYSAADGIGRTTTELNLWADQHDRDWLMADLLTGNPIVSQELRFRRAGGAIGTGLLSASAFTLGDEAFVLASINDISDRKQVEETLRQSMQRIAHSQQTLQTLSLAAQAAHRARTPPAIYQAVGDEITKLGLNVVILELDPFQRELSFVHLNFADGLVRAAENLVGLSAENIRVPWVTGSSIDEVLSTGKAHLVADNTNMAGGSLPALLRPLAGPLVQLLGIQQGIYSALMVSGRPHGLLFISGAELEEGDVPAVEILAAQISSALENAQLFEALQRELSEHKQLEEQLRQTSIHDALTGLYNRGYFEEEMARLGRGRQFPVSILMADLNNLKAVNDGAGHAAGDALLRRAVQVLGAALRAEDVVARIGGDEFAVLLPNTDAVSAGQALARIRNALREQNDHSGTPLSIALGTSTAEHGRALIDALKEADTQMYADKTAMKYAQ